MINTHWLELPLSRTYFHGSIGVRAIEVLLYIFAAILHIRRFVTNKLTKFMMSISGFFLVVAVT